MIFNQAFIFLTVALTFLFKLGHALSQNDINDILAGHNRYRAKHGAPALKWDNSVAVFAQKWTNRCVFQHSGSPSYGENLAMGYGSWSQVVDGWYSEVKSYNYNSPGFASGTGHFTQVVWKGTTKIGCGFSSCNDRKIYSCNYKAPGNYLGQFSQNVSPPVSS